MNPKYFKYLLVLVGALITTYTFAQRRIVENLSHFDDRPYHFGFYLGLNTMDFRIRNFENVFENPVFKRPELQDPTLFSKIRDQYYGGHNSFAAEIYQVMPGFTVGGVFNYRVNRDIDLRITPGMSLGSRSFKYFIPIDREVVSMSQGMDEQTYLTIPSAYLEFPVGFRYKGFRHYNVRPYIYLGAAYRYDLENKRITESVVHLNKSGTYAETGLGFDSYLEYFRFTFEFRFSYGFNNLIQHDSDPGKPLPVYGYMFKELNSNIFSFILYFE